MICNPKHTGPAAEIIALLCFILTVVMFLIHQYALAYGAVFQLFAVLFLGIGLYMLLRYKLTDFTYILRICNTEESGIFLVSDYDWIAERVQGQRHVAECRLSLEDLVTFQPLHDKKNPKQWAAQQYGPLLKWYYYTVNLFPQRPFLLLFQDHSTTEDKAYIAVVFEPDNAMIDQLQTLLHQKNQFTV